MRNILVLLSQWCITITTDNVFAVWEIIRWWWHYCVKWDRWRNSWAAD